jgi:4-hydroxybenzoate polyprenyltransferase
MKTISNYMSLVKFSHTIFALPFAIIGFILALRQTQAGFDPVVFVKMLLCMVFARSAAMAFNRYIDRDIDSANPRTVGREIPAGVIKPLSALVFVIINCVAFIAVCFFINRICFLLSPLALFIILGYSYTKRYTALCHLVLGLGLSLAPIGAYLTITGYFDLLPVLYSLLVLFWVSGFDIIYALQDEGFDRSKNLKSIPVVLGIKKSLRLSSVLHLMSFLFLCAAGIYAGFGIYYWIGTFVFSLLLVYQHSLVKPDDLSRVNLAFFTTNGIASLIFGIFVVLEVLWK